MRPSTLAEAIDRVRQGEPLEIAMAGFLDTFLAADQAGRLAALVQEPKLTGDVRLDALAGGMAEYLSKRYRLDAIPAWVGGVARVLAKPWFTTTSDAPAMREYLSWASPAEFRNRNIFTDERPFLRARSAQTRD